MSKHRWIQSAVRSIKKRGTTGKCTPISKAGCSGHARALALTFKKMARNRKKEHGGEIEKYPFGGAISKGITGIAKSLGASDKNAQLWGSGISTLTGFIPGMQDNLLQGADLIRDIGSATGQQGLEQFGQVTRPVTNLAGMFTGDTGNIFGKFAGKSVMKHGGMAQYSPYHNLSQKDYNKEVINVERNELEVKGGKVITDYSKKPNHPKNESKMDLYGNTLATPGNIIVPKKQRDSYLEGDKITRSTIESQLKRDQLKRNNEELAYYRHGGKVDNKTKEEKRKEQIENAILKANEDFALHYPSANIDFFDGQGNLKDDKKIQKLIARSTKKDFRELKRRIRTYNRQQSNIENLQGILSETAEGQPVEQRYRPDFGFKKGGKVKRYQYGEEIAPAYDSEFMYEGQQLQRALEESQKGQSYSPYNDQNYIPGVSNTSKTNLFGDDYITSPGGGYSTPKTGLGKNGFNFSSLLPYAAPAYNIGMGLLGKIPEVEAIQNPEEARIKQLMGDRKIDLATVFSGIDTSEAFARKNLRNISGGSQAAQLEGLGAIQRTSADARAKARLESQGMNLGYRGEEAQTLGTLGQQNVAARERQRQLQLAMEANQAQYLPAGIGQISGIAQQQGRDKLLSGSLEKRQAQSQEAADREYYLRLLGL